MLVSFVFFVCFQIFSNGKSFNASLIFNNLRRLITFIYRDEGKKQIKFIIFFPFFKVNFFLLHFKKYISSFAREFISREKGVLISENFEKYKYILHEYEKKNLHVKLYISFFLLYGIFYFLLNNINASYNKFKFNIVGNVRHRLAIFMTVLSASIVYRAAFLTPEKKNLAQLS